jgi:hypothetical protein
MVAFFGLEQFLPNTLTVGFPAATNLFSGGESGVAS